uniref:Solute carrier family 37 member 2 n=1 Tax=Apteryx owenii TaxID=8824 RepID=A0A8B9QHE9_APTOW
MRVALAPGIRLLRALPRDSRYRGLTLLLTFLFYTSYHLSRKPISIVKSQLHLNCSAAASDRHNGSNGTAGCSWAPFDGDNYKELFGALDNAFLVAYAIGMFISGIFGERLPLRYYLSGGMVLSGVFTALFGLGYFWDIHVLWYFIVMQICNGLVQTTGWPAVVACVGNWFGKGKRGLIMGVWNSHTSVGNILGSLIAGVWVSSAWGLSFVVPGAIIAAMGLVCFFFLVEHPEDVGCSPPLHHAAPGEKDAEAALPDDGPLSATSRTSLDRSESPKEAAEEAEAISFLGALRIPGVVEFSLCLLFAKLVSYTFLYWLPLYIVNVAHFGAKEAGDLSTLFDAGGIVGALPVLVWLPTFFRLFFQCCNPLRRRDHRRPCLRLHWWPGHHVLRHAGCRRSHALPVQPHWPQRHRRLHGHADRVRRAGQRTVRPHHHGGLRGFGNARVPQGQRQGPRHRHRHHRRHRLRRCRVGTAAGRPHLAHWLDQRLLHADRRRCLRLLAALPPGAQGDPRLARLRAEEARVRRILTFLLPPSPAARSPRAAIRRQHLPAALDAREDAGENTRVDTAPSRRGRSSEKPRFPGWFPAAVLWFFLFF